MIITSQGFGHFTQGMNNQDFGISTPKMLLVLDGCSGAKYSEVGTRLFAQLLSRKENIDDVEKFEENIKQLFDELLEFLLKFYQIPKELEEKFIMENLLFTIIACFETENAFIVKLFGDGYVISKNNHNLISYMKFSYGKFPPYFAYKYCDIQGEVDYKAAQFKTFVFDKAIFKSVGIASDGVLPFAKGELGNMDESIISGKTNAVDNAIKTHRNMFFDDVTIAIFGGENNGSDLITEK